MVGVWRRHKKWTTSFSRSALEVNVSLKTHQFFWWSLILSQILPSRSILPCCSYSAEAATGLGHVTTSLQPRWQTALPLSPVELIYFAIGVLSVVIEGGLRSNDKADADKNEISASQIYVKTHHHFQWIWLVNQLHWIVSTDEILIVLALPSDRSKWRPMNTSCTAGYHHCRMYIITSSQLYPFSSVSTKRIQAIMIRKALSFHCEFVPMEADSTKVNSFAQSQLKDLNHCTYIYLIALHSIAPVNGRIRARTNGWRRA